MVSKFLYHCSLAEERKVLLSRSLQVVISIRAQISTVLEEPHEVLKTS